MTTLDGLTETPIDITTQVIKHKVSGKRAIVINHGEIAWLLYPEQARTLVKTLNDLLLKIIELDTAEKGWSIQ